MGSGGLSNTPGFGGTMSPGGATSGTPFSLGGRPGSNGNGMSMGGGAYDNSPFANQLP